MKSSSLSAAPIDSISQHVQITLDVVFCNLFHSGGASTDGWPASCRKHDTALHTAMIVFQNVNYWHGILSELVSDKDPRFTYSLKLKCLIGAPAGTVQAMSSLSALMVKSGH